MKTLAPSVTCLLFLCFFCLLPARSHAATWEQAETRHFLFIFEPRDRPAADELLTYAEDVYAKVTSFFGSYPDKVPCILRGRVDMANGFTTSFPARIELYLTAPTDHFMGARTESWLKVLLTHELTHFVHQSMDRGLFHGLSVAFGGDIAALSVDFLPGWAIEGPSTNLETRFTEGGRGRNPLFEMLWKAPVEEEGHFLSLEQAGYPSAYPPSGRIYVAGYLLVNWLRTTYGEDSFARIMRDYLGFPFFGPWSAIRKVTGRTAAQVFADLDAWLAATYRAIPAVTAGTLVSPDRIGDWTHPQVTSAGLYVYRHAPDVAPAIVRLDPATGRERLLLPGRLTDLSSFTATADGATLYLSSELQDLRNPSSPVVTADLSTLDVRSGALRQLTTGAHLWHPAVSPDGRSLVAVQGVGPYTRLVGVDPATGALTVLYSAAEGNVYTPSFSPDGRRLAFTFNLRGFQDVYTADLETLRRGGMPLADPGAPVADVNAAAAHAVLGPDPEGEYFPSFLDNDRLLFSSDRAGSMSVYEADLGTGRVALVQADPVAAISAVPDGDTLIYASYSAKGWCLKRTALSQLSDTALPVDAGADAGADAAQNYPGPIEWTGRAVASHPYIDWPRPLFWLPDVALTQAGPGTLDLQPGVGVSAAGASLLGLSRWQVQAAWTPGTSQPLAVLLLTTQLGITTVNATAQAYYNYVGYYSQTVLGTLDVSVPLLALAERASSISLAVHAGLTQSVELASDAPFTFADSLKAPPNAWGSVLWVNSGASFNWQAAATQLDFNPPLGVAVQLDNQTPVTGLPTPQSNFSLSAALNLPSPVPHQVVKVGVKALDVLGGPFSSYTESFTVARGFGGAVTRSLPGRAVASVDYMAPIALLDQPLFGGWAFTALGVGVHAEGMVDWDNALNHVTVNPSLYVGMDVTVQLAVGAFSFPLGFGLAARIDTASPASFDPGVDLRPYVFVGFDSFAGAASGSPGTRVHVGSSL